MRDKVIKGGSALLLRQVMSVPVSALGIICVSKVLNPVDFGNQAILVVATAVAMMLVDLGTSQALVQSPSELSSAVLQSVQRLKCVAGVLTIALLLLLSRLLVMGLGLPGQYALLFPAAGLLGWLQSQRAYQAVLLQRKVEWQTLARIEMGEVIVYNTVLIISAWLVRSVWCFVIALGLRQIIGAALLKLASGKLNPCGANESAAVSSLLRFGMPLQATTGVSILLNLVNPLVVGRTLGMSAVGIINWGNNLVSMSQLLLQPLPGFMFTVFAERRRQNKSDRNFTEGFTYLGTLLTGVLSVVSALFLELLIPWVFGTNWLKAAAPASILLLGNVIFFPSIVFSALMTACGHSRKLLLLALFGAVALWLLAGLGTLTHGLVGFAWGANISSYILLFWQCRVLKKAEGIQINPNTTLRLLLLGAAILWLGRTISRQLAPGFPAGALIGPVVGTGLFGGLLLLLERGRVRVAWAATSGLFIGQIQSWFPVLGKVAGIPSELRHEP